MICAHVSAQENLIPIIPSWLIQCQEDLIYVIKLLVKTTSPFLVETQERCVPNLNEDYLGQPIKECALDLNHIRWQHAIRLSLVFTYFLQCKLLPFTLLKVTYIDPKISQFVCLDLCRVMPWWQKFRSFMIVSIQWDLACLVFSYPWDVTCMLTIQLPDWESSNTLINSAYATCTSETSTL